MIQDPSLRKENRVIVPIKFKLPLQDSGQTEGNTMPVSQLLKLQTEFTKSVALLIVYAHLKGYSFTFADAYDTDNDGGHMRNSNHHQRLAIDLNLFVNGDYVTVKTKEYVELGTFWKSLHPLARWGGDFSKVDANHYSFEYNGVK